MALFKKKTEEVEAKTVESEVLDADAGTAADVEAVMKKYDRESNVRVWEGTPKWIVRILMAFFSVYSICVTLFDRGLPEVRLSVFLGMIVIIGFLTFPIRKDKVKPNSLPWYDIVIMVVGAVPFFYFAATAKTILNTGFDKVSTNPMLLSFAVVSMLVLAELCRRSVGLPILFVVGALMVYALSNVRFGKVIADLFYSTNGVMGTPIGACQKFIVVFIIFGAFLERTGVANFFIQFANSIAGASTGGPAKVAVIASALEGMVSGSSVGNTVGSGSLTIPMMKRLGYKGEFAGAVEAAASTGGQIMPPIMGAAAFLMAEYTGTPYPTIALMAILPAVLYFTGIYIAVHLEAKKLGLRGIPKEELPKLRDLVKKIYLLTPLVLLIVLVGNGTRSLAYSAALSIIVCIIVGIINPEERLNLTKFVEALEAGAKGTITVAAACAMAGMVAGCITVTGLASKLLRTIVVASGGVPLLALFLTMLCCIILGMGVPTTANYCIMAATCAPILMSDEIGITMMAAHFFVFYFGIVADITPPVALAAYAGSAIAKASPMKTAVTATKLAIAAFIVPYIFAINPNMLLVGSSFIDIVTVSLTSLLGLYGVALGLNGYLYKPVPWYLRLIAIGGGLALMIPGWETDLIGLVCIGGTYLIQRVAGKRAAEMAE